VISSVGAVRSSGTGSMGTGGDHSENEVGRQRRVHTLLLTQAMGLPLWKILESDAFTYFILPPSQSSDSASGSGGSERIDPAVCCSAK
jgi:hypothetical protein